MVVARVNGRVKCDCEIVSLIEGSTSLRITSGAAQRVLQPRVRVLMRDRFDGFEKTCRAICPSIVLWRDDAACASPFRFRSRSCQMA